MTKKEILKKHSEGAIFASGMVYDGFTDAIYVAMDEYAKQQCLDLLKWKWGNVESDGGYPDDKRFITYDNKSLTPEELYNLFINNPSK